MKPVGQRAGDRQPESIEFVPKRELDRVQQENDRLRKENERLKQEANVCAGNWKSRCVPASARPHRIRAAHQKPTHSDQAANQAAAMAGSRAVPSPRAWMNESRFHCRSAARIAAAA